MQCPESQAPADDYGSRDHERSDAHAAALGHRLETDLQHPGLDCPNARLRLNFDSGPAIRQWRHGQVCINKIIAVSSIFGLVSQEGFVLKRSVMPLAVYGLVAGLLGLVIT